MKRFISKSIFLLRTEPDNRIANRIMLYLGTKYKLWFLTWYVYYVIDQNWLNISSANDPLCNQLPQQCLEYIIDLLFEIQALK